MERFNLGLNSRKILYFLFGIILFGGITYSIISIKNQSQKVLIEKKDIQSISYVELYRVDLEEDLLKNYPDISIKNKNIILDTILSESEKYKINPLILYSVCYVESSFKYWIEHTPTLVLKDNKRVKIQAVGLTGVVWEWHKDLLISNNIAETRSDLFDPVTNIKAGAAIYNSLYLMEPHKASKNRDESALLRYFGGSYIEYVGRIDAKIATLIRPKLYRKIENI